MAILPIDLQTLFSQVDKVARAQLAQREGLAIQQAVHGTQLQRKADEQLKTVKETQDVGDGPDKVSERERKEHEGNGRKKKNARDPASAAKSRAVSPFFRDPGLGRNVDISF